MTPSKQQIRYQNLKQIKNEDVAIVDVDVISDEDETVLSVQRDWIAAGLRVSNSERDRVRDVNGDRNRVSASNAERERVPDVNGESNRVNVVNVVREKVNAVIAKRLKRVNRVSDSNGEREMVTDVNSERNGLTADNGVMERVNAVNGVSERVPAINGKRKRVKRVKSVPAVNGVRERVPAGNSQRKRVKRVGAVNDESAGDCSWVTTVTKAVQKLKVKQTLHIPSWVVQERLRNSTGIHIRSVVNNRMYDCTIRNPGRGEFERYITHGWYDFLSDHKPKVGEQILFDVKTPELMVVDMIRRGRHSK